jgi:streptogramin lyase
VSGGGRGDRSLLTQIDPQTGAPRNTDLGRYTGGLAWSGGYGDLWIAGNDDGTMMRLNPTTGVVKTINAGAQNPVSPVTYGDTVWVGDWSNPQVVRLPAVGSAAPQAVRLPVRHAGCPKVSCVWTVAAGAGAIWATTPEDDALWRINPNTNAVKRLSLPYPPTGVTADASNVWVTVRG